jgi:predicted NACHT family NTPase
LVNTLLESIKNDKVLFVLDGLDEIITDGDDDNGYSLKQLLDQLLQQSNVVITSRPYGIDTAEIRKLDLEFEDSWIYSRKCGLLYRESFECR